jgi:hypothetical protein
VLDEPQAKRRAFARCFRERTAVVFSTDNAVLAGHRARDPRHVVAVDETAQRRHESAAAAPRDALAVGVARVRRRTAVGDDDELPALAGCH